MSNPLVHFNLNHFNPILFTLNTYVRRTITFCFTSITNERHQFWHKCECMLMDFHIWKRNWWRAFCPTTHIQVELTNIIFSAKIVKLCFPAETTKSFFSAKNCKIIFFAETAKSKFSAKTVISCFPAKTEKLFFPPKLQNHVLRQNRKIFVFPPKQQNHVFPTKP